MAGTVVDTIRVRYERRYQARPVVLPLGLTAVVKVLKARSCPGPVRLTSTRPRHLPLTSSR